MIAAEAANATGETPAERLVMAAAEMMAGEHPADAASSARGLLARRVHRDYPGGFAASAFSFSAASKLLSADALEDAERAMDALRVDAEKMAQPELIAAALCQQAIIAYQRGDLPRCELEARAAIEAGGDFVHGLTTPWLVMVLVEQARLDAAEQLLGSAGLLGEIPATMFLVASRGSRGRLRLAQNDPQRAIDDLAAIVDHNAAYGMPHVEPPWRPLLVEALVLADRTDEAVKEAETYATLAAAWGTRRALGHTARMRALIAPREQAIALLDEAATHFAASHARLEHARALTELGARRRAAGDRRAARAILRDAHDAAHTCRATALCETARAELLLAGGRPRPPAGAGADALTPAERRIAEIAADGATNAEIARRLYLSPKTVEMHLRSAYRKLDLTGRDKLAAALPRTGASGPAGALGDEVTVSAQERAARQGSLRTATNRPRPLAWAQRWARSAHVQGAVQGARPSRGTAAAATRSRRGTASLRCGSGRRTAEVLGDEVLRVHHDRLDQLEVGGAAHVEGAVLALHRREVGVDARLDPVEREVLEVGEVVEGVPAAWFRR